MTHSIVNSTNSDLHLLNGGPRTLCKRPVTNGTMIPLSMFGRPADDAEWCKECSERLAEIERPKPRPKPRGKPGRRPPDAAFLKRLGELHKAGFTQREMALRLGVSQGKVGRWLKVNGI